MSYKVNRAVGYQPWGVTNPWVFANYGQPQRKRGYVSPMVFQTAGPFLKTAHLGQAATEPTPEDLDQLQREVDEGVRPASDLMQAMYPQMYAEASPVEKHLMMKAEEDRRRSQRMERYAVAGVLISATSFFFAYRYYTGRKRKPVRTNRRRRRRTSRKR